MLYVLRNGVLVNGSHNISYSHGPDEIGDIFAAYDQTLAVLAEELSTGDLDKRLGNNIIRPVF